MTKEKKCAEAYDAYRVIDDPAYAAYRVICGTAKDD